VFPRALVYPGERFKVDYKPILPPLPEDFKELSVEEQAIIKEHHWEVAVQSYHMAGIRQDPRHVTRRFHPYAPLFIEPILVAPDTWEDGIHTLKCSLVVIQLNWDLLNNRGVPCPLRFSPEEITLALEDARRWQSYDDRVESLFRELELGPDGTVDRVEKFELVKKKSDGLRAKWDVGAAGGPYPLQDGGRSLVV